MAIDPSLLISPDEEQASTIQQTVGGMQAGAFNVGQLQQASGALAKQTGEQATQQLAMQGEEDLQQQARQYEIKQQETGMNLKERQLRLQKVQSENELNLNKLKSGLDTEAFNRSMKIEYDNLGRAKLQAAQLVDLAVLKAKSQQELRQFEIQVKSMHARKLQMLKNSYTILSQEVKQQFERSEQDKDQEMKSKLAEIKRKYDEQVAKANAEASKWGSLITGAFTVAGAVIGGIYTAGTGTAAGAAGGAALGSMISSQRQ